MSVVFSSPPSLYKTPTGTAVGMTIVNGSPVGVLSVLGRKVGRNAGATLSAYAEGIGGTPHGPPGTLSQYLNGLGIITGMSGMFRDSISRNDGAAIIASVDGSMNELTIEGVAFNQVGTPSQGGACKLKDSHGIEAILAYFQDNRMANIANAGRFTIVKIGKTELPCKVIGVNFEMFDTEYNIWKWRLTMLATPAIKAGSATVTSL